MGMLLSVRGIRKSFGAVAALRHADLDMAESEVVALLGDNGAGKSTFVRLLSGAGRPDGGTFRFGGNPVDLAKYSVRKARDMGIETVHQPVRTYTVHEILQQPRRIIPSAEMHKKTDSLTFQSENPFFFYPCLRLIASANRFSDSV